MLGAPAGSRLMAFMVEAPPLPRGVSIEYWRLLPQVPSYTCAPSNPCSHHSSLTTPAPFRYYLCRRLFIDHSVSYWTKTIFCSPRASNPLSWKTYCWQQHPAWTFFAMSAMCTMYCPCTNNIIAFAFTLHDFQVDGKALVALESCIMAGKFDISCQPSRWGIHRHGWSV